MKILKDLKLKDRILISVIFIALIFIFTQKVFINKTDTIGSKDLNITISGVEIIAETVETVDEMYKGLSFREGLKENHGMLFVHKNVGIHEYAMRDMLFNLDFIFIRDEEVVDIAKNVSKDFRGIVKGGTTYDKVLEISAGWVERNSIELGDGINYE